MVIMQFLTVKAMVGQFDKCVTDGNNVPSNMAAAFCSTKTTLNLTADFVY